MSGYKGVSLPEGIVSQIDERVEDSPRWNSRAEFVKHAVVDALGAAR